MLGLWALDYIRGWGGGCYEQRGADDTASTHQFSRKKEVQTYIQMLQIIETTCSIDGVSKREGSPGEKT